MMEDKQSLLCLCGSAGSIASINKILSSLDKTFPIPIIIVVHQQEDNSRRLYKVFQKLIELDVSIPNDGTLIQPGNVYVAPPGYHIQVEPDYTISYSMDEPVHFSRPSIDVFLLTATRVYQEHLHVVLLSGSSNDGTSGLQQVEDNEGQIWIQDPSETTYQKMLHSALQHVPNATPTSLTDIIKHILELGGIPNAKT